MSEKTNQFNFNKRVLSISNLNELIKSQHMFFTCSAKDKYGDYGIIGYNVRPLEMSGAIGIEQLKKLPSFIKQRRKNAEIFVKLFKDDKRFLIQKEIGESSWFGFSLIIMDKSINRKKIIDLLTINKIDSRPIVTGDFTKNDVMKFFNYEIHKTLENADHLHYQGFFLGNSHVDLTEELNYLKKVLYLELL